MKELLEIKEAIILAAGRSRRMEYLSEKEPKCLLKYNDERVLCRLVRQLKQCGIQKIVITTGYRAGVIKELFKDDESIQIVENKLYEEDVNIFSMKLALAKVNKACVVFEADMIVEDDLVKFVCGSDFEGKSVWFTKGPFVEGQYGGILKSDKYGKITDIRIVSEYKKQYKDYSKLTGIMRINQEEISIFKSLVNRYAKNTIKQYFLNAWIENLEILPCEEADISAYDFYTFNKPEEYFQVQNTQIGVKDSMPQYSLLDVSRLHSIEEFNEERLNILISKIVNDGVWSVPVIVDKNYLVLDGQHRLEAAKRLGLKYIPAIIVDYANVKVWTLRKEERVSQKLVLDRVTKGNIYPYKTVKHKFPFVLKNIEGVDLRELK